MTATRSRKSVKTYQHRQKTVERPQDGCVFCMIDDTAPQYIGKTEHFKIIQNIFPYTLWDSQTVLDHILVVPAKHTDTLADISPLEAQDFVRLISDHESKGYSVWARPPGAITKSLTHQHTHLIKLSGRSIRFLLYFRRPYLRWMVK